VPVWAKTGVAAANVIDATITAHRP